MTDDPRRLEDEKRWSELMKRAQLGDSAAYERLLVELGHAIEAYVRNRFGGIDLVEDCVQECLLTIHRVRRTWNPDRSFRPWLFTIVRNQTIDVLRRDRSWRRSERAAVESGTSREADEPTRLVDGVVALQALPEPQRQVILLAKYGGLTAAEVAHEMGISEGAVKVRLHRALKAIASYLREQDT